MMLLRTRVKRFLVRCGTLAIFAAWTSAMLGAPLHGQEAIRTPQSKVERKNRAPVSKEILRVKLPKPIEAKLSNGLTVLILEDHRAPFINLQLHIEGAGALFEPRDMAGLANATAQMLREGTASRSSIQIAEEIDRVGAALGAGTSFGSPDTVLSASGLSNNFDEWFAVAVDILLHPSFPANELEKFKQRQRAVIREQRSASGFLVSERFNRVVYGQHPAAIISPTMASIDRLNREALIEWHQHRYAPQHAILGVAGDVHAKELIAKLERGLASWKKNEVKESWPPDPSAATARKVFLVNRPNSVQTTLALGNIAISRSSPEYPATVVTNHVLGGSASSRLFLNLREEKGYTYGVYSSFSALQYPGAWRAGGNMRTEVTDGALTEFFHEFNRIRELPVPAGELEASKRSIVASFALSLEQPARVLGFAVIAKRYHLPSNYWDTYPEKIMAVSAADVQRIARKYLDPQTMQVVAVGDAVKIEPVLAKYGKVEVFNTNGTPAEEDKP